MNEVSQRREGELVEELEKRFPKLLRQERWARMVPTQEELEELLELPGLVDRIAAELSSSKDLEDLAMIKGARYRPSLYYQGPESLVLAVAYDRFQASRGDGRKAFRGGRWPGETKEWA